MFGKTGMFGWQDACRLALENSAHPPFFVRKLWSYFIPLSELDARTQRTLEQTYVSGGYKVATLLEPVLLHPALYEGPRMMKPPIVYNAGLLRLSGRFVDGVEWTGFADSAGQRLFYPPNVAGWDDERWLDTQTFRARWVLARQAITKFTLDYNRPAKTPSNSADAIIDRALAYWDNPTLTRDTRAALKEFTVRARGRRLRPEQPGEIRHDRRERAPPARRRVPRLPDLLMADNCNHCNDYSRSELLRAAIAEAGHGLPGIEPGMPLPAGTGLSRRTFVARSVGMLLAVYGASKLPLQAFEEGIANAASAAPNAPVLVTVFLSGGVDALSLMFPAGDPLYAQSRPTLKLDPAAATAFAEDARLFWHPSLAPIAQLYGEGKVSVMPSIGYNHPDQSHFTSRHYWEVGAVDPTQMTGWMGRFLDVAGAPDNPLQGLALDTRLSPALASSKVPVAAIDATDSYTFATPGVDSVIAKRVLEALG